MVQFIKNRLAACEAVEAESNPTRRKRLNKDIQSDIKVMTISSEDPRSF